MKLSELRIRFYGIACVVAAAGVLAACSGTDSTTATSVTGGGNSTPPPITGIATPSSVSVVTATGAN